MPKIVDHDARRLEIVHATWRLIAAKGFRATTMREIAKASGVANGGLFPYFRNKEELIGVLEAEVVLISTKSYDEDRRWVYLDIGRFGGLAEVEGEGIRYRIRPVRETEGKDGPVVLAGPTCDSADILYDKANYQMPHDLKIGDRVRIFSTGAYTTTYSSVEFNGFPPLKSYYIK